VDQALFVDVGECAADLGEEVPQKTRFLLEGGAIGVLRVFQDPVERGALEIFHGEVEHFTIGAGIFNPNNVGVLEPGEETEFPPETADFFLAVPMG
jgi:hypothetical protein